MMDLVTKDKIDATTKTAINAEVNITLLVLHFQKEKHIDIFNNLTKLKFTYRYLLLYLTNINTVIVVGHVFSGNNLFGLLYSICYICSKYI
jgi:hypothetical protein